MDYVFVPSEMRYCESNDGVGDFITARRSGIALEVNDSELDFQFCSRL